MTIAPEDLGLIKDAAYLGELLPTMKAEFDRMERALENRMYQAIRDGTMTGQIALNGWLEKMTYRAVLTRLDQKVRLGQSVGSRNAAQLIASETPPTYSGDLPLPGYGE